MGSELAVHARIRVLKRSRGNLRSAVLGIADNVAKSRQSCWRLPIMLPNRVNRRSQLIEGGRARILVHREFWTGIWKPGNHINETLASSWRRLAIPFHIESDESGSQP